MVVLDIKADVVDISKDSPLKEDSFLVDTNVWYWMTYSKASVAGAASYQVNTYPQYTSDALGAGSKIYQSGLSMAELSHVVEKVEREMYEKFIGKAVTTKIYRHNLDVERTKVCSEISSVCKQVSSMSSSLDVTIDAGFATAAIARIGANKVDGYDLFILESMALSGITQIITDDGDFTTVPGIRVFTANRNVIAAAKKQGRLVVR